MAHAIDQEKQKKKNQWVFTSIVMLVVALSIFAVYYYQRSEYFPMY